MCLFNMHIYKLQINLTQRSNQHVRHMACIICITLAVFRVFLLLCNHDLSFLALFQVLCIPVVPSITLPHPTITACGYFLSMCTHSCHAACQYAINS